MLCYESSCLKTNITENDPAGIESDIKVQSQSIKKAPIHIIISTIENCMTKKAKYENTPYC